MLPFFLSQTMAIARLARGCDLIHAHWILSAVAATLGAPIHRRPVVCTVQGSDVYQAMRMPAVGAFGRHALRNAHKVIALSKSLADAVATHGINPQKITIIPNGVDAKMFAPNGIPREPVILFAGSLIQRKGVRTLIEAMALVHRRHPAYKLVLIGDGPLRKDLEIRTGKSGLSDCVRFTGSLPPMEVARWMRRSELFVLPSLEEGQGVVLLEALASGTPCVASNIGGIPETLSPEWGALFPPGDAQALACATLDLLDHADRRRSMGREAAHAVRERYDWPVIAHRVLDLYAEAVMSRKNA
jgi:glycosyltransferase involved in cell wall biosynthesis